MLEIVRKGQDFTSLLLPSSGYSVGDGTPPVESDKIVKWASGSFSGAFAGLGEGSGLGVLGEVTVESDPETGAVTGEPIGEGVGGEMGGDVAGEKTGFLLAPRFALTGGGVSGGGGAGALRCLHQKKKFEN